MSDVKTEDQLKADAALAEAIQATLTAYELNDGFTLVDFVVLTATQKLEDDGTIYTSHPVLLRDGDLPWYKILGLMKIHEKLMEATILSGIDNG
jgi:hypothetical protein